MRNDRRHTSDDDAVQVNSWRKGDFASFEALVGKYQKRMLNVAFRITGDYENACEVVQDAFVAAFRGIDSFRGSVRFSSWLTALVIAYSRDRLQQRPVLQRNGDHFFAASAGEPSVPAGNATDASCVPDGAGMDVMNRHVQACITSMLADFRVVLVLSDLQNVPCSEIGTILRIREATVKSRLFQAREMVRDYLARTVGER